MPNTPESFNPTTLYRLMTDAITSLPHGVELDGLQQELQNLYAVYLVFSHDVHDIDPSAYLSYIFQLLQRLHVRTLLVYEMLEVEAQRVAFPKRIADEYSLQYIFPWLELTNFLVGLLTYLPQEMELVGVTSVDINDDHEILYDLMDLCEETVRTLRIGAFYKQEVAVKLTGIIQEIRSLLLDYAIEAKDWRQDQGIRTKLSELYLDLELAVPLIKKKAHRKNVNKLIACLVKMENTLREMR